MQSPDSEKIIDRFFIAFYALIEKGDIKGKAPFARKYNINRGNFYQLEKNRTRDIFQVAWLTHLVVDYNISPRWLLTGEGEMLTI